MDTIQRTRIDRILNPIIPRKQKIRDDLRVNPRYLFLVELRKRVWRKVGWESDGKGVDPWRGRTFEGVDADHKPSDLLAMDQPEEPDVLTEDWDAGWLGDGTDLEGLDTLLSNDPMDIVHWDEWESLATGFFAS